MIFHGAYGKDYKIIYPPGCNGDVVNFWIRGEYELPPVFTLGGTKLKLSAYHFESEFECGIGKFTIGSADVIYDKVKDERE